MHARAQEEGPQQGPERALGIALSRGRRRAKLVKRFASQHEPLVQQVGRAASTSGSRKKQMRGRRGGFGRLSGRFADRKLGRRKFLLGESICVRFQGKLRRFSRRASQVHGVGLFVEEHLKAGEVLGYFTGELLSRRVGEERRRRGAKSIVEYDMGEEGRVFIDASRGRVSPFQWINSVAGSSAPPNVQFAVVDERLCVETRMAVDKGEELLADYSVGK